jgi:hypothetical protein
MATRNLKVRIHKMRVVSKEKLALRRQIPSCLLLGLVSGGRN